MNVGIDLGGTSVAAGIVDDSNRIICRYSVRTAGSKSSDEIIKKVIDCTSNVIKKSKTSLKSINSIGIGAPGITDPKSGILVAASNLPIENIPIVSMLEDAFGRKAFLDNDANCAAWGEYTAGSARGKADFVMVTLGTGIGGGFVIDRKIVHGEENHAGEVGHVVVDMNGKNCSCGRRGCWETIASTKALTDKVYMMAQNEPDSVISHVISENGGRVDGRTLFIAMRRKCTMAKEIFDWYIDNLAVGFGNIIEFLRPELIVIGGGISKEGETILVPLRKKLGDISTKLEMSILSDNSGIIGAANLYRTAL